MYLYGASGHGKVIAEIAEENNLSIEGFIDSDISKKTVFNYTVYHQVPNNNIELVVAVGNNLIRQKIVQTNTTFTYLKLIHPQSVVSKSASIDEGTVVMAGVVINAEAAIGKHCIINTNASIDHECHIHNYVHISPNAALAGNVEIGEGTHIGIGATIIQGIKIGKWCTIGAGAVIIRDVPDFSVVVGNPGRVIKKNIK